MKVYGKTKGTELEKIIGEMAKGEAMAASMYFALSHIAKEQGREDLAEKFIKIGTDEARHSGLYAYLNGAMNENIIDIIKNFEKEEGDAYPKILALSEKAKELKLDKVASLIKSAALDEKGHQKLLEIAIKNESK